MSATINDLADGLQTRLATITTLHNYSEAAELPHDPSAEVIFQSRRRNDAGGGQVATFVIEVSAASDDKGWSAAARLLRPYLDATGTSSIEAAIASGPTLGGKAHWCAVASAGPERRVQFGDGWRWAGRLTVEVCYDP